MHIHIYTQYTLQTCTHAHLYTCIPMHMSYTIHIHTYTYTYRHTHTGCHPQCHIGSDISANRDTEPLGKSELSPPQSPLAAATTLCGLPCKKTRMAITGASFATDGPWPGRGGRDACHLLDILPFVSVPCFQMLKKIQQPRWGPL